MTTENEEKKRFIFTPEQIDRINNISDPLHGQAVFDFYNDNFLILSRMAYRYVSPCFKRRLKLLVVVSHEDLLQQLFLDLLCGYIKLSCNIEIIRFSIYKSFKFAPVGGLEVLEKCDVL